MYLHFVLQSDRAVAVEMVPEWMLLPFTSLFALAVNMNLSRLIESLWFCFVCVCTVYIMLFYTRNMRLLLLFYIFCFIIFSPVCVYECVCFHDVFVSLVHILFVFTPSIFVMYKCVCGLFCFVLFGFYFIFFCFYMFFLYLFDYFVSPVSFCLDVYKIFNPLKA